MDKLEKEIYELHCYWSDVVNYPPNRKPDKIIVDIKKKLKQIEHELYSIKYVNTR